MTTARGRGRGPVSQMVPRDQQLTEEEEYSQPVGGRGGPRGPRRTLAQKIADMERELTELKWGGVKDAANQLSPVIEALEDGEDKDRLFNIYRELGELLKKKGVEVAETAEA